MALQPVPVDAVEDGVGAAAFTRLGASARAIAMGRAYTALAGEDAMAVFWNPAGLVPRTQPRLGIMNRFRGGDSNLGMDGLGSFVSLGGVLPLPANRFVGAVGLGSMVFKVADIPQYNAQAQYLGDFASDDKVVYLSGARLEGPLAVGLTIKYISLGFNGLREGNWSAQGVGLDMGLLTHFRRSLSMGFIFRKETKIGWDKAPTSATMGWSYQRHIQWGGFTPKMVLAADFEQIKNQPLRVHSGVGLERLGDVRNFAFSLRLGVTDHILENRFTRRLAGDFKADLEQGDFDSANRGWALGLGVERNHLRLDYTFSRRRLHNPQYVSISFH
ncbi:MAG: hypothetical protein GKR89_36930 [Candidatus Latescibacteria bacterium]|nr:hypothetical protein [Candidatus Latescibacterota bacterium]